MAATPFPDTRFQDIYSCICSRFNAAFILLLCGSLIDSIAIEQVLEIRISFGSIPLIHNQVDLTIFDVWKHSTESALSHKIDKIFINFALVA